MNSSSTRTTWQSDLKRFYSDAEVKARVHALFEPLYAQIAATDDETAVIELLSRIPITGKLN